MKKFVTLFMTGLLAVMCSTTVFAGSKPDVTYSGTRAADTTY